jgi:hypothetical protein
MARIGCDLDGVLADYASTGSRYADVVESETFWTELHAYLGVDAALARLRASGDEAYFITRRFGVRPQQQTAAWLGSHGYPGAAVLIVQKNLQKRAVCRALNIDAMIDDSTDALILPPSTKGYLVTRSHNAETRLRDGVVRVSSVVEALADLGI